MPRSIGIVADQCESCFQRFDLLLICPINCCTAEQGVCWHIVAEAAIAVCSVPILLGCRDISEIVECSIWMNWVRTRCDQWFFSLILAVCALCIVDISADRSEREATVASPLTISNYSPTPLTHLRIENKAYAGYPYHHGHTLSHSTANAVNSIASTIKVGNRSRMHVLGVCVVLHSLYSLLCCLFAIGGTAFWLLRTC